MLNEINTEIISFLFKGELPSQNPSEIKEDRKVRRRQKLNLSKQEIPNSDQLASINRQVGQNVSNSNTQVETVIREKKKIGRNEKVTIRKISTSQEKIVKFKIAENLIRSGDWVLIDD